MDPGFEGKVVLVTGASAGIGERIALMFAKFGAKLSIVGRNETNIRDVAARCQEQGQAALAIVADLSTNEGCERVVKETLEKFGRLDVLVNNAAAGARANLDTATISQFDAVFASNVRSVYYLTTLLAPELIKTKGNIVNISSVAATMVSMGSLPYSMTKAALDHFTDLIALELAPKGVRANTVSPGITDTKFVQRMAGISEEEYKVWLRDTVASIPLGKVCHGDDIARSVLFLASDNLSGLTTGARLQVDGAARFVDFGGVVEKMKD